MSINLYEIRLFWNGNTGGAKAHGAYRHLMLVPRIIGIPSNVQLIDYAPEVGTALIRDSKGVERSMSTEERKAVQSYVRGLFVSPIAAGQGA